MSPLHANQYATFSARQRSNGACTETCRQEPVIGQRRTTALYMAERSCTQIKANPRFVFTKVGCQRHSIIVCAFGDNRERVRFAARIGVTQFLCHYFRGRFDLRYHNHLCAASDARHQRQVTTVAPHHFNQEGTLM
jgi:hypothetical protein